MNFDRIYLTGFMGSGKSSVAPRLARGLGYDALDLDDAVVSTTGLSIPALFDLYGEEHFRKEERQALLATGKKSRLVVSLGGGVISREDNLDWLLNHGVVIYLKGSAGFLASRLAQSRRNRPLLFDEHGQQLEKNALHERVSQLLSQREARYERAHFTIDIDARDVRQVVAQIRRLLVQHGGPGKR